MKKKWFIYLFLTLIPAVVISFILAQHKVSSVETEYKSEAQEFADFHAMNIGNFLGETVGRLEMLSTSIKVQNNNKDELQKILQETEEKDSRFSGFYWSNSNGDLLIGSNPIKNPINVSDRAYFQQALKTKKTSLSEAHIGRVTGRYIISVATPFMDDEQVTGVLIASLRIDEVGAAINSLIKEEMIVVIDETGKTLIRAGSIPEKNSVKSSMKVAQIPWTISAYVTSENDLVFRKALLQYFIIFLTITNILYLSAQNLLLRKKVNKEKEQMEIHKLELIGNLAASTAHEIRNPLTGIKGLVKLLSEEYREEKAQAYFEVIQLEIDRINAIVGELLVLGKPTAYTLKTYNANEIVAEIEPIIHSEANFTNVEFSIHYHSEDLPVSCIKDQLKQVILNLSKNSLQAMPNGGRLSINIERQDESCLITVADNGIGMQKEQIAQAFKPFFTLKKDGSGLGLTVCKRIIDSYGGKVFIKSVPNEGTQVEIILPLAIEPVNGKQKLQ
ncbi:ATP-binding protein [Neobacillus novalis]|uniref:histidine kinase n=2 Tax=Neobacillus novalis TaxID=220687 RepID=A0AA95SC30_9BACI|nr:ATP-binding protein [Neobacillus novalis]WHY87239.1 ATP-binding protein [Neobacillus novalis]